MMPRPRAFRASSRVAGLVLVLLSACGPTYADGYEDALARGLRAQNAGRYDEAVGAFEEAANLGDRYKDRDEARLLAAEALEKLARYDEAEAAYRRVVRESEGRFQGVRAAYAVGRLVWERRGFEAGSRELLIAIRAYPQSGLGRSAVRRMLSHVEDEGGPPAALAWLEPLIVELRGTELEQIVLYERGLLLGRGGRLVESRDSLVATARAFPYPSGALTDDAYYQASILEERLGRFKEAIALLEEMRAPREVAYVSSYERPRFSQAAYRIGVLYRDKVNDPAAASRAFRSVYEAHPKSRYADDALWQEALIARGASPSHACTIAETLREEYADSRFLRCARLVCPSAPADAAHPCPDYIVRDPSRDPSEYARDYNATTAIRRVTGDESLEADSAADSPP